MVGTVTALLIAGSIAQAINAAPEAVSPPRVPEATLHVLVPLFADVD